MKRISSAELAQLASLPPLPVATGLTLTEQERHARELAAKALSMPSTVDGPGQPTASDGALDELCEWLRTEPALNEEVVQAARPKLRAEQVPLPAARRTVLSWLPRHAGCHPPARSSRCMTCACCATREGWPTSSQRASPRGKSKLPSTPTKPPPPPQQQQQLRLVPPPPPLRLVPPPLLRVPPPLLLRPAPQVHPALLAPRSVIGLAGLTLAAGRRVRVSTRALSARPRPLLCRRARQAVRARRARRALQARRARRARRRGAPRCGRA